MSTQVYIEGVFYDDIDVLLFLLYLFNVSFKIMVEGVAVTTCFNFSNVFVVVAIVVIHGFPRSCPRSFP